MKPTAAEIEAGQAVYTNRTLPLYDLVVLGVSNRFIWQCPTARIEAHYQRHLSANHLDVGVGSGYFLDRCRFPGPQPRLALMDMNRAALDFAAARIDRHGPERYVQNVLEAVVQAIAPFDSIGVNYLFHCLPGRIGDKALALDHLAGLLKPGATLFGSTILGSGVAMNWAAKRLMAFYNRRGIFANRNDSLDELRRVLEARFEDVTVDVVGCVALFAGRKTIGATRRRD